MNKSLLATSLVVVLAGCALNPTEKGLKDPNTYSTEKTEELDFKTTRTGRAAEEVLIAIPKQGAIITSPLEIKGKAPGYWFFEATAPVDIVSWDGSIIGSGFIQTQEDWMTEKLITFTTTIDFELPKNVSRDHGWIIFQRHNASGLPEHDSAVEVPIQFERE